MKPDIHPVYYPKATIVCACGAKFSAGSTKEKLSVEICSHCHPFFTGNEKVLDTAGRVERFREREKAAAKKKQTAKNNKKPVKN